MHYHLRKNIVEIEFGHYSTRSDNNVYCHDLTWLIRLACGMEHGSTFGSSLAKMNGNLVMDQLLALTGFMSNIMIFILLFTLTEPNF